MQRSTLWLLSALVLGASILISVVAWSQGQPWLLLALFLPLVFSWRGLRRTAEPAPPACPKCRQPLRDADAAFCAYCGAPLSETSDSRQDQ